MTKIVTNYVNNKNLKYKSYQNSKLFKNTSQAFPKFGTLIFSLPSQLPTTTIESFAISYFLAS